MNTREIENDKINMLEALTCFISNIKGNKEKLKNCSFLRGIRGYFWTALDEHFSHEVRNKKNQNAKIKEILNILEMESKILRLNSESKIQLKRSYENNTTASKTKLGKLMINCKSIKPQKLISVGRC
jgi:hypothetical protein